MQNEISNVKRDTRDMMNSTEVAIKQDSDEVDALRAVVKDLSSKLSDLTQRHDGMSHCVCGLLFAGCQIETFCWLCACAFLL